MRFNFLFLLLFVLSLSHLFCLGFVGSLQALRAADGNLTASVSRGCSRWLAVSVRAVANAKLRQTEAGTG
jgi:hypothetical protein